MFTLNQIHEAFSKVKSGADFPQYVKDLKLLGVEYYDNYVSDGQTIYYGANGYSIEGEPKYDKIPVSDISSEEGIIQAVRIHQKGDTDYPTFCHQAAEAGVEKWRVNMITMNVSYFDKNGRMLIDEKIPVV